MDLFYGNITTFPTVIFTIFVLLSLIFWSVAVFGLIDLDFLNLDMPDADVDISGGDSIDNPGLLTGIFLKFGLAGVPFPMVFTILSLVGWAICYYCVHFIFPLVPGKILEYLVGAGILIFSFYSSALITGKIIKPLRPMFEKINQNYKKTIIGKIATVRTSKVNKTFGEATVEDGGAGLIVKIRSFKNETFSRGDKVVLLEYIPEENVYKVISENEFNNS
jgi:hypothetical protein